MKITKEEIIKKHTFRKRVNEFMVEEMKQTNGLWTERKGKKNTVRECKITGDKEKREINKTVKMYFTRSIAGKNSEINTGLTSRNKHSTRFLQSSYKLFAYHHWGNNVLTRSTVFYMFMHRQNIYLIFCEVGRKS